MTIRNASIFNNFIIVYPLKRFTLEPVAKLPATEKSMILGQFAGVATRPELRRQGPTRESRTWRRGDKVAQKGDFAGAGGFATVSLY